MVASSLKEDPSARDEKHRYEEQKTGDGEDDGMRVMREGAEEPGDERATDGRRLGLGGGSDGG
jgi:hypothetical protein